MGGGGGERFRVIDDMRCCPGRLTLIFGGLRRRRAKAAIRFECILCRFQKIGVGVKKALKKWCLGVVESISRYAQHFTQQCGAWGCAFQTPFFFFLSCSRFINKTPPRKGWFFDFSLDLSGRLLRDTRAAVNRVFGEFLRITTGG